MQAKTIAIINSKGGCGKTTSAVLLSQALSAYGSVELRDSDPQGSASEWLERAGEFSELPFDVVVANRRTVGRPSHADWVVIDTPPGKPDTVDAAIAAADFVIIPTSPTGLDTDRMWATLDATHGKARAVLITRSRANTRGLSALLEVFDSAQVPQFETVIPQRETIAQLFGRLSHDGELGGYRAVAEELVKELA